LAEPGALTRRVLLAQAGAGAALLSLGGALEAIRGVAQAAALPAIDPGDPAVRATMAAFADTIVPGPAGGADRFPGAVEANVIDELYDPFYGAYVTFPLIHDDLIVATPRVLGRAADFELALPYRDRERVMADRIEGYGESGDNPLYVLYIGIATLVYLSYYGTAQSGVGPRYIGFPPESDGYHPHHSYGVRFRGMTEDGNPR
jgi:hypothetical protein